jgi:5-methyltetrahydrofolate--homocysteine methyltransferase
MFEKLVLPILVEQCERLDHAIYHWDGPGEIPHLEMLLSIKRLDGIQWVPGAAAPQAEHPGWFPYYRRIQKAGKRLVMNNGASSANIAGIARQLDPRGLLLNPWWCPSEEEAQKLVSVLDSPR